MATQIRYINNVKSMNAEAREELRRKAYQAFLNHETGYDVSIRLKVRKTTVYRWYKEFETRGEAAIVESKRGVAGAEHKGTSD